MDILTDIRVLSFNHFLLGPMGTQVLADLGADVISIEPVGGAFQRHWGGANHKVDGESMLHLCGNRNKKNLAIDIKDPAGHEIIQKLLECMIIPSTGREIRYLKACSIKKELVRRRQRS